MKPNIIEFFESQGLPPPVAEYQFHPTRRWRFDFAWLSEKIALEVEGAIWTGGRHTSAAGFHKDMEKYNAASVLGWRVLRVTPNWVATVGTAQLVRDAMKVS